MGNLPAAGAGRLIGYRKATATATPMMAPTAIIPLMMPTGHATSRAAVRPLATAQMMKVLDNGYLLSLVLRRSSRWTLLYSR